MFFVELAGKLSLSPEICFASLADMKADKAAWISIRVISETNHMILSSFYFRSSQVPLPASRKADLSGAQTFPPLLAGASDVWQSNLSGGPGGFARWESKGSLG